jgi:hypothetical protein
VLTARSEEGAGGGGGKFEMGFISSEAEYSQDLVRK